MHSYSLIQRCVCVYVCVHVCLCACPQLFGKAKYGMPKANKLTPPLFNRV